MRSHEKMAITKFGLLFIMTTIILQICEKTTCESSGNLQQGFTTRCDELCSNADIQEDLRPDCQRGCQYFNIEFLVSASNKNKVTDLETTNQKCRISCLEAYSSLNIQAAKKDACNAGCRKMNDLQRKAPYINGWLVYMGAPDHSMVLLQPDLDISSDDDWVLLDSVLRNNNNDYDKMFDQYKVTETRIQTIPVHECNRHFSMDFSWLWIFPLLGIMFATIHLVQKYDINNMNETFTEKIFTNSGFKSFDQNDNFVVSNDTYFYPSPAIPPPKYNEAIEAMLLTDEEETNVENELKCSSSDRK